MSATLVKDVELDRVGSHSVSVGVNYRDQIEKEECFGYFSATWRGEPVRVTVSADRYRHSSGMSEWRIYARDARIIDPTDERNSDYYYHGHDATDTARRRLGEMCVPLMEKWIASNAYVESRRAAFVAMFKRCAGDLTSYATPPSRDLRHMVYVFAGEVGPADVDRFTAAADAFDQFRALVDD